VLVGIFSIASGYLVVLIYEHAASVELTKSERAQATNVLNIAFQVFYINNFILYNIYFFPLILIVCSILGGSFKCGSVFDRVAVGLVLFKGIDL